MRKKCSQCGFVNFIADESCKKCGSDKLFKTLVSDSLLIKTLPNESRKLPIWGYPIFFILALIAEFVALLPILANLGMRHSANAAVTDWERSAQFWIFILHLPSSVVPWLFTQFGEIFSVFYLFVPFTQIIFWTFFLPFIWKKLNNCMESN